MRKRMIAIICAGMLAFGMSACRTTDRDAAADSSLSQAQAGQKAVLSGLIENNALEQVQNAVNVKQAAMKEKKEKDEEAARLKEEEARKAEEARKQEEARQQEEIRKQEEAKQQTNGSGQKNGSANGSSGQSTSSGKGSYANAEKVYLNASWQYADHAAITSGAAVMYKASENRKDIVVGVNAGHGTSGGGSVKTLCHPDGSPKTTGGTTASGSTKAVAVSGGMTFSDGTGESTVTLRMAQILRDKLLDAGYDVLMIRDGSDVQLDNVARTVICNNVADCHISLHWDGDGLNYDKGCFYISVPDGIKGMEPVASHWKQHNALGASLVDGLRGQGCKIKGNGSMAIDLTQTSYSTIPSVDIELGNGTSDHSDATLAKQADGLVQGVRNYFGR